MPLVLILGLAMTAVALPIAGRRVWWLYRLITSGQPAPDRTENVTRRIGQAVQTELVEVFGQKKLLKWTVPGAAHFFVFWAFVILLTVYIEAYGALAGQEPGSVSYYRLTTDGAFAIGIDPAAIEALPGS